jgi:hypothetical protein
MRMPTFLLAIALLLGSAAARPSVPDVASARSANAAPDDGKAALNYEQIAKTYAASIGLGSAEPTTISYEDVLTKAFVQLKLGAFDVRFPRADLDKRADELRTSALALVTAQEKWLDWLAPGGGDQKTLRDDLKILGNWVKGWKAPNLAKGKDSPEPDLGKLLNAPDTTIQASQRLFDALARGAALGPARELAQPVRLIITPSRKEFTEFIYFFGWINADQRGLFWLDNAPDWTSCFIVNDQLIALEYAAAGRKPDDYSMGTKMDEVLPQQIVQLAMNALFSMYYGEKVSGPFLGGLSMNLVIDAYGEVRTRIDGDTRSKVTGKREVFVAGGASEGGFLGKNSAETKWRENGGKDHFLGTLHAAQEEGGKLAKDAKNKAACFSIRSDDGGQKWAAVAPFLGTASADTKPPPKEFAGDFAEFYRAYKSAFIFWLQTKSMPGEKASREKFALMLKKLADPNMSGDFDQVFKDVYEGAVLSGPGADKDTLEGKFLIWLSRQR